MSPVTALAWVFAYTEWLVERKVRHPQHLTVASRFAVGKDLTTLATHRWPSMRCKSPKYRVHGTWVGSNVTDFRA
jgi:hypothetical protein